MKFRILFFMFLIGLSSIQLEGQKISKGLKLTLDEVESYHIPYVDNIAEQDAEAAKPQKGRATAFAVPFDTNIKPSTHGTWEQVNGRAVWRIVIKSHDALSLNFGFTAYQMPKDGHLFIYSLDRRNVMGPFTPADNETHNQLWTPIIDGAACVIEVSIPADRLSELDLEIGKINHGFKDVNAVASGSCNLDVICGIADGFPQIENHRDIIRSAATYSLNGFETCSGALINNGAEDCTPYFLTADHCGVSSNNAPSMVVYWNYENSVCRQPNSAASGANGNGVRDEANSGAILRAEYGNSDMSLVELDDPVVDEANAYFAGWDRSSAAHTSAVAIHHPALEEKRISFENDPGDITTYFSNTPNSNGTHVRVIDWDLGTTEGGSSGSPLFDQNERIIGQLHGGGAACGNNQPDWYGRVFISWEGGGSANSRLKDWLDPNNTGMMFMDGRDATACGFAVIANPLSAEVCASTDVVYNLEVSDNFTNPVTLSTSGLPASASVSYSSNPATPGTTVTMTVATTGVTTGAYTLDVMGTDGVESTNAMLGLTVFSGTPAVPSLSIPTDGQTNTSVTPAYDWGADASGTTYSIEVATDMAFANIIEAASGLNSNVYSGSVLNANTTYYWRVKADNTCGTSSWSSTFSFTTANIACGNDTNTTSVGIGNAPTTISSSINVTNTGSIADVNVLDITGTHSYISDLIFTLTSPEGTTVTLVANACDDESDFFISFDDQAASSTLPCSYNDGGTYQPVGDLADFNGEMANGTWVLTIEDTEFQDGGALTNWTLEICTTDNSTSNTEILLTDFSVFPNPASKNVSLDFGNLDINNASFDIMSVDGKVVLNQNIEQNIQVIDVSQLASGVYFIHFKNKDSYGVQKLIVE